ncbi:SDR family oxidoreductase [Streptomyces sp. A7024]|uniref:SDR family oxidoreductase n=1 Tax=Streptomyces coryli TaxID=1128680 RepID=A0A6G4U1G8_9ACTN|nr:UDP-glucuronic acid decarboxylase family protein [Streptomyces coryli]NGN65081.1 SDR family oxidoreductase [Streptomyces coryli]
MRAVVTGGAGFIGSHLCERLFDSGYDEVWCLDDFSTGRPANVAGLTHRRGFKLVQGDIVHGIGVAGKVDAVLHFASPASPIDYLKRPLYTLRTGAEGTRNALELAARNDARFVLASTSEVYGDPEVHPQTEGYWGNVNPVGPRSCYDEAKRYAEALAAAYVRERGTNAGIIRIFNTFGPRMRAGDGRVVPNLIRQALTGDPMTVTGDGSQTRSLCYVDDLVGGVMRMLGSDIAGPVNLGNPHELSMLELAEWIRELTGSTSGITMIPLPEDDPKRRRPNIELARTKLDWQPSTSVAEGLRRTIAWFADAPSAP